MSALALRRLETAAEEGPADSRPSEPLMGMSTLVRMAYEGRNLTNIATHLYTRASANPFDASALYDLSILLQTTGQREKALEIQSRALTISRRFTRIHGDGTGPRVLVIATLGDLMANTPIDFLLETSNARQELIFVDEAKSDLSNLPDHDVAFFAIGEAPENAALLDRLDAEIRAWPGPIMNNAPSRIRALTRDGTADLFANATHVLAPKTVRMSRSEVDAIGRGASPLDANLEGQSYPIIIRPVGTHAGTGLEKITSREALLDYLTQSEASTFYLAPFIDYANADGLFRKQRIAFIDGIPYASHLAVSEHWIVHYLSAGMTEHADRREEEAKWMAAFETETCVRLDNAFAEVQRIIGLDYFAIDCAELADGRLLLFEADVAMIVHALDSPDLFPYKTPAMDRLFAAFMCALETRSRTPATRA